MPLGGYRGAKHNIGLHIHTARYNRRMITRQKFTSVRAFITQAYAAQAVTTAQSKSFPVGKFWPDEKVTFSMYGGGCLITQGSVQSNAGSKFQPTGHCRYPKSLVHGINR